MEVVGVMLFCTHCFMQHKMVVSGQFRLLRSEKGPPYSHCVQYFMGPIEGRTLCGLNKTADIRRDV